MKKLKNYRFHQITLNQIEWIAKEYGCTNTAAIEQAVAEFAIRCQLEEAQEKLENETATRDSVRRGLLGDDVVDAIEGNVHEM